MPVFIMTPATAKATRKRKRRYTVKVWRKVAAVPHMAIGR